MSGSFEIKKGDSGKFMFNLKSGNSQVILTSQTYTSKESALAGIESVKNNSSDDARFERKISSADQPYFVLTATNGQTIGKSQMYSGSSAMENGIESVKSNAADATLVDNSDA